MLHCGNTEVKIMSKLLKLIAVGALLAVGPIQAFAVTYDLTFNFYDAHDTALTTVLPTFNCGFGGVQCVAEDDNFDDSLSLVNTYLGLTGAKVNGQNLTVMFQDDPPRGSDKIEYQIGLYPPVSFLFTEANELNAPHPLFSLTGVSGVTTEDYFLVIMEEEGSSNVSDVLRANITTAIPEPETYAMIGIGLVLMGFVARRRRQQGSA